VRWEGFVEGVEEFGFHAQQVDCGDVAVAHFAG
jgi:hypothetical protein